jgi:hypothetical protein
MWVKKASSQLMADRASGVLSAAENSLITLHASLGRPQFLKLASLKSECNDVKSNMPAAQLKSACTTHGIPYVNVNKAKLALLEWVCGRYGFPPPRLWLQKDLLKIKYPEEHETAASAAVPEPRRELGYGLALAERLASSRLPFDSSRYTHRSLTRARVRLIGVLTPPTCTSTCEQQRCAHAWWLRARACPWRRHYRSFMLFPTGLFFIRDTRAIISRVTFPNTPATIQSKLNARV